MLTTTNLPRRLTIDIKSINDARRWISSVIDLGLLWNLEEDAREVCWNKHITDHDIDILNAKRDDIFESEFDWGEYEDAMDYAMAVA